MIVGSKCLEYWGLIDTKQVKDLDVWVTDESHLDLYAGAVDSHIVPDNIYSLIQHESGYITPDTLLTIKMSHLAWDIKWDKTKRHILMLTNLGYKKDEHLYQTLKKHWEGVHGDKSFLSLGKNKEEFFTDKVVYKYDHDYLHELVALPHTPLYNKCLKDGEQVLIDKGKFFSMPYQDQIQMFREEITVIAIERWIVNPEIETPLSFYKAYKNALKRTITNLTKGWATDFIIDNLGALSTPDYKLFNNVNKVLEIDMSRVDLELFENIAKDFDRSASSMVFDMCEGDVYFGDGYVWENKYPSAAEFKTNTDKYTELLKKWQDERITKYAEYCKKKELHYGYEHLHQTGGGEGGSEYCEGVFKLNGVIYKAEYSYYSYDGHNYDDILETLRVVTPVQKTITVYE